jgi:RIO-like serine/threonine protein kinase
VRLADGRLAVLKDLSRQPDPLRRAIGRVAMRREHRAYERLANLSGIPDLLDVPGPGLLLLEYAGDASLEDRPRLADPERFVSDLEAVLVGVHRRGVSHGEVRLANVVVGWQADPYLVDFATSTRVDAPRTSVLFRLQCRLDRYGWLMIKNRLVPGSLTPSERQEERQLRRVAAFFRHNVV